MTQQINKRFVEYFLKINGVRIDAPQKDIRAILERARWSSVDIDRALHVCAAECGMDGEVSGRTFRPDVDWTSAELSDLLGVRVAITPHDRVSLLNAQRKESSGHFGLHLLLCFCAAALAATVVFAALIHLS